MESVIMLIKDNTTSFIALATVFVSILSVYLSLTEYYRVKAKNDFFFIEDDFRKPMRNSFHPEYLSFSIVILVLIFTFYIAFYDYIKLENCNYVTTLIIVAITYIISFFFNIIVFLFFQHSNNKEIKIWHKNTYRKNLFLSASAKAGQWFFFSLLFCLGGLVYKHSNNMGWFIFGFLSGALTYLFADYYVTKKLLITFAYAFLCFKQCDDLFLVLATKDEKQYCVQAKTNEQILEIYVNKVLIIEIGNNRKYERIFF